MKKEKSRVGSWCFWEGTSVVWHHSRAEGLHALRDEIAATSNCNVFQELSSGVQHPNISRQVTSWKLPWEAQFSAGHGDVFMLLKLTLAVCQFLVTRHAYSHTSFVSSEQD